MNIFPAVAVAVFSVFMALLLKKRTPEIALLISLSGAVIAALSAVEGLSRIVSDIGSTFTADEKYLIIPLKSLGITLISSVASKLCEDAGEKAVAFTVLLAGKTAVLLTAMPLFYELIELLARILKIE